VLNTHDERSLDCGPQVHTWFGVAIGISNITRWIALQVTFEEKAFILFFVDGHEMVLSLSSIGVG